MVAADQDADVVVALELLVRRVVDERRRAVALHVDVVDAEQVVLPHAGLRRVADPADHRVGALGRLGVAVLRPEVRVQHVGQPVRVGGVDAGRVAVERVLDEHPLLDSGHWSASFCGCGSVRIRRSPRSGSPRRWHGRSAAGVTQSPIVVTVSSTGVLRVSSSAPVRGWCQTSERGLELEVGAAEDGTQGQRIGRVLRDDRAGWPRAWSRPPRPAASAAGRRSRAGTRPASAVSAVANVTCQPRCASASAAL